MSIKNIINITFENVLTQFKLLTKQIMLDIENSSGTIQHGNMFRLRTINSVIKLIDKYRTDNKKTNITEEDLKNLLNIKGIGKGTIDRIREIITTGKLSEIKITEKDHIYLKFIEEISEIYGIGEKTAYKLFKEKKVRNIEDLKRLIKENKITLPEATLKGLKYLDRINDKIKREEIDEVGEFLLNELYLIDPKLFGTVCGSYRRLRPISGDVDFIIVHPNPNPKYNYISILINRLKEKDFIVDSLSGVDVKTKYMGIYKWKSNEVKRIDIRFIPYESYYYATLYFTGPKDFNRKMRMIAISSEMKLNEYGLYDSKNKMYKVQSEKEIFDLLHMEYLRPDQRN